MSTHKTASTAPAQPTRSAKRRWPDMSFYGIHFGVVEMPNGEARLVMVDEQGAWAALAKRMGFAQSRWFGLYVKSSLKLDIPGFAANFPSAKVIELSDDEIRARIKPLILGRKDQRLSQMHSQGRISWHPNKTEVAVAASEVVAEAVRDEEQGEGSVSPEAALRQTLYLGMNFMGQDVYESGDGLRFVRGGEAILARESADSAKTPVFLRAVSDDDLVQVAAGMVKEIDAGKRLHSDDFIRFIEAARGAGAAEDKEAVGQFHAALDAAMRTRVSSIEGAGRDAFDEALRLHEGRPSFWRAPGTWATPLPISVVMQSLAAARAQGFDAVAPLSIIDITDQPQSHSWSLAATSVSGGQLPSHDIAVAGVFGRPSSGQHVAGLRITRSDSETLLASLEQRNADGMSVFVMTAGAAGKMDNEFRRVISTIGQKYEVSGLADIDPSMIGPGNEQCSRLVVVGRKREQLDFTFAVSGDVPVIYDYASLWGWGETLRASAFGEVQTFGDDGREENRWQAPYIPSSQVTEPKAMSPRNLLGPVRKALARIVERNGMGVDEYVCAKLGWTMEQLEGEERLDAEQVDAVAIGIQAIDDGKGMVEADATGLGKGRVAAALCLYCKRKGMPVMFMTEKSDLFGDFYRDVADIGAMEELGNPFIINNDLIVRNPDTAEEIARSPKREQAAVVLACGEQPKNFDIVLATYSQFNRVFDSAGVGGSVAVARAIKGLVDQSSDAFTALTDSAVALGLPDYKALGLVDAAAVKSYEVNEARAARAAGNESTAAGCDERATLFEASVPDVIKFMSSKLRSDMTTLKHQWLYSGAMNGGLLLLDEAHCAAGDASQTGTNIRHLVENAGAVVYSSATYAKDIKNFVLYSRLFPSELRASNMADVLGRGGEPMQELLTANLAEDGRLIRREHDLSNLEFRLSIDTERKERNETWANGFAKTLATLSALSGEVSEVVNSINAKADLAVARAKNGKPLPNSVRTGVQYTNFSSKFYNIARAFSMAVNADQAADLAIKALKEGRKPVITVENTMESVLRELLEGVELDDEATQDAVQQTQAAISKASQSASVNALDPLAGLAADIGASDPLKGSGGDQAADKKTRTKKPEIIDLGRRVSFKDILREYVDVMFTATEKVTVGSKVTSSKRISLATPEMLEVVKHIHTLIDEMPEVPLSPLDLVKQRIADAGYSVDEISGRRITLGENPDGTHRIVRMSERKKQPIKNAFNSGKLDALILSKSGSTGISLHANRTFADQSQRELIELQPAADIAQRFQFWGRVNRKGQVCSPIIRMLSSGLPWEKRLITMQNAKLRRMSANISGNADNSALNDSAPDILNHIGNEVCYRWMEANPAISGIIGYKVGETPEDAAHFSNTKFVDTLTGRMMMLDVPTQHRVYAEITQEFNALIEQYELEGRNPLKSAEHDLRARKSGTALVQVASGLDSVFNAAVQAVELSYDIKVGAIDRASAEAEAAEGHLQLVETYGEEYGETICKDVMTALDAALPAMLPKRYSTIEQALNDTKPNAVKNASIKFSRLRDKLPQLQPGSIIAYSNEVVDRRAGEDWGLELLYITGWKVPQDNKLSLAGYRLTGYSRLTRKRVELTLASLLSRPSLWIEADIKNDSKSLYKSATDEFFARTALPINGTETRIVLEGNLYRAAELAEAQKQGSVVTYSDEKGVWHHAVLMPKRYTLDNVVDLPVTVDSLETLQAAVADNGANPNGRSLIVSDDFREGQLSRHTYKLYANKNGMQVTLTSGAEKNNWMLQCADVKACLHNSAFEGTREHRQGRVVPGMEDKFLAAFMSAANEARVNVLLGGEHRAWYNDYLLKRTGQASSGKELIQAAMSTEEDDELQSLLAMTP